MASSAEEIPAISMKPPIYALLGNDSSLCLLFLSSSSIELVKLIGCDSPPIGVYEDINLNYTYVLTESLSLHLYNSRQKTLERRLNMIQACEVLRIDQIVYVLRTFNESIKMKGKNEFSLYDFFTFEKTFKRK